MENIRNIATRRQGPSDERIARRVAQVAQSMAASVERSLAQIDDLMSRAPGGKDGVLQALGADAAQDLLAIQAVMAEASSTLSGNPVEVPLTSDDVAGALSLNAADVDTAVAGRRNAPQVQPRGSQP